MSQPWQAAGRGFPLLPMIGVALVIIIGGFTALYVWVLAPAGNVIDKANQSNQLKHDQRQSAIINQENKNVYGSIGYQDAQIGDMQQNLTNITGPAGLALTRAGLSSSDGEQASLQASEDDQVKSMCSEGVKVAPDNPQFTSGSPSLAQIYAANCTAGTVRANPPLAMNPVPNGGA